MLRSYLASLKVEQFQGHEWRYNMCKRDPEHAWDARYAGSGDCCRAANPVVATRG